MLYERVSYPAPSPSSTATCRTCSAKSVCPAVERRPFSCSRARSSPLRPGLRFRASFSDLSPDSFPSNDAVLVQQDLEPCQVCRSAVGCSGHPTRVAGCLPRVWSPGPRLGLPSAARGGCHTARCHSQKTATQDPFRGGRRRPRQAFRLRGEAQRATESRMSNRKMRFGRSQRSFGAMQITHRTKGLKKDL